MSGRNRKKIKQHLLKKLGNKCYYCKCEMDTVNTYTERGMSLEHLYCRGDIRRWCNHKERSLVLACRRCNSIRPNPVTIAWQQIKIDMIDIRDLI